MGHVYIGKVQVGPIAEVSSVEQERLSQGEDHLYWESESRAKTDLKLVDQEYYARITWV